MNAQIDHNLEEIRRFRPSPEFAAQSVARQSLYTDAADDRLGFWADRARELHWHKPFTKTLDWTNPPFATWFEDGELNVAYNCLDRHVLAGHGDRIAIHWEGEPGDSRDISYAELTAEVKRAANLLTSLGIEAGDRVAIYLPMIPEAVVAMLAIARIGAVHSVVFGGFSPDSLHSRILDAEAKLVITADGGYRKGRVFGLKDTVDAALGKGAPSVAHVLVVKRTGNDVAWEDGRDLWWGDEIAQVDADHEAKAFPAEQPLFILYTSGTTGKPKGILHTSGGYLTQAAFTHRNVFDLHPESDVYWCTADVGWITGHSYVVYGPLANGATQVLYEGTPDTPHPGRWWEIIEKYKVSILYTAPTAIRSFMKVGRQIPQKYNLRSLRVLGSVGEPINPEAWIWYRHVIGGGSIPVVDTWWQTETGGIMISALPGITDLKPGSAQIPIPGISLDIVTDEGEPVSGTDGGLLVITEPWPAMLRGIWGDPERFKETYWDEVRRQVLRRRRRPPRRGRRHLAARPCRRRDERVRPPPLDGRDRVVPRGPRHDGGSRRGGSRRRDHRPGRRRVRDPQGAPDRVVDERGGERAAARPRRPADRRDRTAPPGVHRQRAAEDPLGQDHATPVARPRRGS